MHYHLRQYFLLDFKKMDKLVMMINQGINELSSLLMILLDTEVRDFPSAKFRYTLLITFITIKMA